MRSVLVILLIIGFSIVMLPALLVFWLKAKKDPAKAERWIHACMSWLFDRIIQIAGTTVRVHGAENVPDDRPVLYACNHCSFFDTMITYPKCKLPTAYIAKSDLKSLPLFGLCGQLMRCLFFDRNNVKQTVKMISDGTKHLKTDMSVFIFPEGTRNKTGKLTPLAPFHDGSFKMAQRSGCPIIPVALTNTANIWEAHMPWLKKTTVDLTYGEPVVYADLSPEDQKKIGSYIQNIIEKMLE